jgi:broad specificity phosphatase PhoE
MTKFKDACTIYLFRHGRTEGNNSDLLQGQTDTPLTREGIAQIKKRAQELVQVNFSAFYSSDTLRAKSTAEIIAAEHNLIVSTSQLIRERHFGTYEGKYYKDFKQNYDELLQLREKMRPQERYSFKFESGYESDEEIMTRFIKFIRETSLAHPNQTVGVVSHGGIIRTFLIHLGWATYQTLPAGTIENTAYVVIESDSIDFQVIKTEGLHKISNTNSKNSIPIST